MAACGAPSVRVNTIATLNSLLSGNTVCVPAVTQAVMTAQEEHRSGGQLWDYKRGPGHSVDPSERVGSWIVNGSNVRSVFVTYDYGGGQVTNFTVWDNRDGTYSFCSATSPEIRARIKTGFGPC
jgi:hypothetical protein